ncbi:MAG: ATP-binding protein, partial [Proteobacteria bacterium]|nr:ATP-binding protein [Pseudomonadota bacterium]
MTDFPHFDPQTVASQGNAILGIRDSGKSYTAIKMAEMLFDAGIPFVAFDPIGRWRFLRVPGLGEGYPVVVAGGMAADLPLTADSAVEIVRAAMEAGVSLVVDLYDMEISKADWRKIVGDAVRVLLYENGKHGLRHIFIEEAAEFAPQRVGPDQGRVYAEIEKLARMGGNARLGYTLINQRAEEVNKAVLELCDNLFLHRQKGRNSLNALSKWLDLADVKPGAKEIIQSLPTLPQGECWAWMAGTDRPVHFKVPAKNSFEPDRRAMRGEVEASSRPPVDVNEFVTDLRRRLAGEKPAPPATVKPQRKPPMEKDVKESEAKALRDENAALKRRIAEMSATPAQPSPPAVAGNASGEFDMAAIYAEVKRRAVTDPELLAVIMRRPAIQVTVQRHTIQTSEDKTDGMLAILISEGFFDNVAT